jgi:hypothetical protein
VHQRVALGEITSQEAIRIFRCRALCQDTELPHESAAPSVLEFFG